MAESAGGQGFVFNANATDGFGLSTIASNFADSLFCGFDKECRRNKNKAGANNSYNLTFGSNETSSTNTMMLGVLGVLLLGTIYLIMKPQ